MRALILSSGEHHEGEPKTDDRPHLGRVARVAEDWPAPLREAGEALVRVGVAGLCDTDLQLARGYMGFEGVPGHEFVGRVAEAASDRWVGRRVVADINAGCGLCEDCTLRDGHHCAKRTVLGILGRGGALAEAFAIPERCLVGVPDEMPDDVAVFAEPLAAALHVEDVLPRDAARVAVLGDGKLGILIAVALAAVGREVSLVGHHEAKLGIACAMARRPIGAMLEEEARESLRGVDAVVDATGSVRGLGLALDLVRPRGTVVAKTTVREPIAVDLAKVVVNEVTLVGSRCGSIARAIDVLGRGDIDPSPLVEARYPLARATEALEHASRRGALKVLVEVGSEAATSGSEPIGDGASG